MGEIFQGIDKALKDNLVLKVFRSGGGLRVARIEDPKDESDDGLKAYGEMPNLRLALIVADKDYWAGGKAPYETHYLTGSMQPEETLDNWILRGHSLHAHKDVSGEILFEATKFHGKRIASVQKPTFGEAYTALNEIVNKEHFEQASALD